MFSLLASRVGPWPVSRADSGTICTREENRADYTENHANLFNSRVCSQSMVTDGIQKVASDLMERLREDTEGTRGYVTPTITESYGEDERCKIESRNGFDP